MKEVVLMNKKLVLVLVCLVLACFVFAACDVTPEQLVLNQLTEQVSSSKGIGGEITVSRGQEVVGRAKVTYDFETQNKVVETERPNPDTTKEDATITSTSTTKIASAGIVFGWKVEDFSSLVLNGLDLEGTVSSDSVKDKLGLGKVDGDVSVVITITGSIETQSIFVQQIVVTYKTTNGNNVRIVLATKA